MKNQRGGETVVPRFTWLISIGLVLLTSCNALAFEVKDSGLVLANPLTKVIFWADEKHVVASIFEKEAWIAGDGTKKGVESIFVWNVETNELRRHAGPGTGGLCVGNGVLRYFQRRLADDKYEQLDRYYGPLGHEQKVVLTGPIDKDTCRLESDLPGKPYWLEEAKKSGRIFKPLKPEHGWLEFIGGDRGFADLPWYPVAVHAQHDKDQPILIDTSIFQPWLDQGYTVRLLRHEAFKNAYLLGLDDTQGSGNKKIGNLWWLYADGRLEEILNYGRDGNWKSARYNTVIPTKTTLLLIGTETHPKDKSGLYREISGRNLEMVISGYLAGGGYALSPDGCKLAFGMDPRGFPNSRYRLHIIDVCQKVK
ncbi:MAG: hypothetical protein V5B32_09895 [Candidatus Accumulibacter sp. UW26]